MSQNLARGVAFFMLGLAKKILLANPCGKIADVAFDAGSITTLDSWFGCIAYAFQIYFDFSGYSDMAIGLGRMFGFRFPENFRWPYVAASVTAFWRRWHISLSTWFRDYLYIPLGGNRVSPARRYFNLVTVFFLCGLWHGAGLTFVLWGALQGGAMVFAGLWSRHVRPLPALLGWAATFTFFATTLVIFRSPSLGYAFDYLATMLSFRGGLPAGADDAAPVWQVAAGIAGLFALEGIEFYLQRPAFLYVLRRMDGPLLRGLFIGLALLLVLLPSYNVNPFIYFRF